MSAILSLCRFSIGIYPEWNVNHSIEFVVEGGEDIGIYPEWNVNMQMVLAVGARKIPLEYIQNGM